MVTLTQTEITASLRTLGLDQGDTVFVHSSLSSMGYVEGGAVSVTDALLCALGQQGTLIVPTFTFGHDNCTHPVFDPYRDRSEMGRVSEELRTRPKSSRSIHLLHSVSALGFLSEQITTDHGESAWAEDGPFGKLYEFDAKILLLGVPYFRCTHFHVIEQMAAVPYRHWVNIEAYTREKKGAKRSLYTRVFKPKPDFPGNDFNKFGTILENRKLAHVGFIGNAVARLFRVRDVINVGLSEYHKDPMLFVKTGKELTQLPDGVLTNELNKEKSVIDPSNRIIKSHE
jgi:aminoglycoside 3-N-acetyltransferase